jgi:general secretion pathway protein D
MELFPYTRRSTRWGICLILVLCLCGGASQAQEVNFDFEDADLRAVIQAVAEFTGRNFLVDPRVQGRVTVVAPTPLTEEQAYQVFQSVLEVNGFVTVEADGATKIVPAEEGKSRDTNVFEDDPQANLDDIQTRVLHLTYVNPERLVPILRPLVPAYGHMAADSESSSLIITDRAANVDRLVSIINRLDRPAKAGELEVIPLVHASAGEMSELLGRLYPTESGGLTVMDDIRTNSIIVKADVATRTEIRGLIQDLDLPTQSSGDTNVIFLNNADAENLAGVLQNMVESSAGQGEGALSSTDIMADPDTNAIIVRASQADFNTIRQVIENLDVRRLQVYVEALIAEVRTDFIQELGIQFQTAEGLRDGTRGVVGGTSFDVGTNIRDVTLNPLATGSGLGVGFIDGTVILPDGTEVVNLVGLARALETDSDNNILSTPNILTMDNQEAEIIVGQNVPFVTGAFSQISSGSAVENPFQTIERRDVGLTLRIKPQITEGSAIKMEIYQEVSSVAQRGEATDIVTNTRSLQTTVVAENNRMLVLGGLIQDDISQNVQKVPLLGDIPILGNLFRYRNNTRNKTNLVVFLLPRIIRGYADMDEPTRRKYEYLEQMTEEQDVRNPESVPPPIQEWDFIVPGREPPETQLEETEAP